MLLFQWIRIWSPRCCNQRGGTCEPIACFDLCSPTQWCASPALWGCGCFRRTGCCSGTPAAALQSAASLHLFFICRHCHYILVRGNRTGVARRRVLLVRTDLLLYATQSRQSSLGFLCLYLRRLRLSCEPL